MEETVDEWHKMENKDKVLVLVLDKACESAGIQRAVEKPYRRGDLLEARPYGWICSNDHADLMVEPPYHTT